MRELAVPQSPHQHSQLRLGKHSSATDALGALPLVMLGVPRSEHSPSGLMRKNWQRDSDTHRAWQLADV